jgi:hypothetical protein
MTWRWLSQWLALDLNPFIALRYVSMVNAFKPKHRLCGRSNSTVAEESTTTPVSADHGSVLGVFLRGCVVAFDSLPFEVCARLSQLRCASSYAVSHALIGTTCISSYEQ